MFPCFSAKISCLLNKMVTEYCSRQQFISFVSSLIENAFFIWCLPAILFVSIWDFLWPWRKYFICLLMKNWSLARSKRPSDASDDEPSERSWTRYIILSCSIICLSSLMANIVCFNFTVLCMPATYESLSLNHVSEESLILPRHVHRPFNRKRFVSLIKS